MKTMLFPDREPVGLPRSVLKKTSLFFWIYFLIFPFFLYSREVKVTAEVDSTKQWVEGRSITGNVTVTHQAKDEVDIQSFRKNEEPLQVEFIKDVNFSSDSDLMLSIYRFQIEGQPAGLHLLPPISVLVGGKRYQSVSRSYEVVPAEKKETTTSPEDVALELVPFIDGPRFLYPGSKLKVGYRYLFVGDIDLTKEVLPLLEAKGFQKIGQEEVKTGEVDGVGVSEISQVIEAIKPGEYTFSPSLIEGYAYTLDRLRKKHYKKPLLRSKTESLTLTVQPFPPERPPSFNGAIGNYTMEVSLASSSKVRLGDPIFLEVEIKGEGDLEKVTAPNLCCQPGFSGRFELSDLPPVGKVEGNSKRFSIDLRPLFTSIRVIPAIQFSFLDSKTDHYQTLESEPISINIFKEIEKPTEGVERLDEDDVNGEIAQDQIERKRALNEALQAYLASEKNDLTILSKGKLQYQIANTFYQLGEYPLALAYYFRVQALRPRDRKISDHIQETYQKMDLKSQKITPKEWEKFFFLMGILSLSEKLGLFLLFCLFGFLILLLFIWFPRWWRLKGLSLFFFFIAALFLFTAIYAQYFAPIEGVLLKPTRFKIDAGEQYAFVSSQLIPEGTVVFVLEIDKQKKWAKVSTREGIIGFLKSENMVVL